MWIAGHPLVIEPRSARCWTTKGELQVAQLRNEEGLRCFDHTLTLPPTYADAWHLKAVALRALGHMAEAEQAERRVRVLGWRPDAEQ